MGLTKVHLSKLGRIIFTDKMHVNAPYEKYALKFTKVSYLSIK